MSVAWEGSRPLLVEIQALVADGNTSYPKRLATGIDSNRLSLLLAVLQRHGDLSLGPEDVFANVVGGLRIGETAVDLPALLAIVSSFRDQPCGEGLVSFGEVGLAGEVRAAPHADIRLREAAKLGFTKAIVPEKTGKEKADVICTRLGSVEKIKEILA